MTSTDLFPMLWHRPETRANANRWTEYMCQGSQKNLIKSFIKKEN